ncbi:hypothetical protein TWF106_004551 [Orbilia oligospora]|uniref:Nucleoside phosphorylase domain-containing protein n=1 Tax=Orbilia oligospora TaxID=2813651 RepID=A0A7C8Q5T1_ORBOL|nr:hypothetical protein TWF106_004551 [Orbilia oligospora]
MESKTPASTLRSIGFQTKKLFKDAIINASALNAKDVELEDPFETQLAVEANRFGLWAMNLGIFAPDHGSLDYRVKDSETIRVMLETFLVSLNTSLNRVLAYYSSFSNDPVQENGGGESSEEDLSGSESSEDGWNEFDESISSNLTLLLDGVRGPLDRLYKLSTWIRNPSSRSISSKVQSHQHIDPETEIDFLKEVENFEIDYIRSVFFQYRILKIRADGQSHERLDEGKLNPDTSTASEEIHLDDSELSLIHRLARANVRRRQRFSYWRKHQEKLALYAEFDGPQDPEVQIGNNIEAAATSQNFDLKQNDKVAGLAAVPPDFGSVTTATRLNIPQLAVFKDDFSAVSVSKYAPSNWLPDNETLEFPEPPNSQSSDKEFECPYCFTICRKALLKSGAWNAEENEKASELSKKANPNLRGSRDGDFKEDQALIFGEEKEINGLEEKSAEGEVSNISSESSSQAKNYKSKPHAHTLFKHEDYEVGWMCSRIAELIAAAATLDERHPDLPSRHSDHNNYILGRIGKHNIVIVLPLPGVERKGPDTVFIEMIQRFTSIRFSLTVGIGSGVPNEKNDIRLGDVVVGTDVIWWDSNKDNGIQIVGSSRPPTLLRSLLAFRAAEAAPTKYSHKPSKLISDLRTEYPSLGYAYPPEPSTDVLYAPDYDHNADDSPCKRCDPTRIVTRPHRDNDGEFINIHYGPIAFGNRITKHGTERNKISEDLVLFLD